MILVTGGAGYIGSHFILHLIRSNIEFIFIDSFINSSPKIIQKLKLIKNSRINYLKGDVRNVKFLKQVFSNYNISSVVHFAGLKSVKESFEKPSEYFTTNVSGTINIIKAMEIANVKKIIFSSSATVYNVTQTLPWKESGELDFSGSPYAQTKIMSEKILEQAALANPGWSVGILRYFNPIGSDKLGLIGENIIKESTNLIPSLVNVLLGRKKYLDVYGADFKTADGSGIRDYIHIDDLINGHIKAHSYINRHPGYNIWNLGTGKGYSVFEVIKEFETAANCKIPIKIRKRRKGDLAKFWADVKKARDELDFIAKKELNEMIKDVINFTNNISK